MLFEQFKARWSDSHARWLLSAAASLLYLNVAVMMMMRSFFTGEGSWSPPDQ